MEMLLPCEEAPTSLSVESLDLRQILAAAELCAHAGQYKHVQGEASSANTLHPLQSRQVAACLLDPGRVRGALSQMLTNVSLGLSV